MGLKKNRGRRSDEIEERRKERINEKKKDKFSRRKRERIGTVEVLVLYLVGSFSLGGLLQKFDKGPKK
ncbi:hypothetical protein VNO78_14723 [Psophocarpus tetragonolobus]|uniref:Uncharacterized protein n=1 Tax=Psophocarpus tetragonolobus TaxID=3891 RepID=A0AAN9SDC9_PSOTE